MIFAVPREMLKLRRFLNDNKTSDTIERVSDKCITSRLCSLSLLNSFFIMILGWVSFFSLRRVCFGIFVTSSSKLWKWQNKEFKEKVAKIAELAVGDACTGSNPRAIDPEAMEKLLTCTYYGTEVDF